MTGKKLFTAVAVGALGLGLAVSSVTAKKNCRKLCKTEIEACKQAAKAAFDCKGLHGQERHACRQGLHAAIRDCTGKTGHLLTTCENSPSTSTCSPSGAFVDASLD